MAGYIRLLLWKDFAALPMKKQKAYIRALRRAKMKEREIAASLGVSESWYCHWKASNGMSLMPAVQDTLCWSCSKAVRECPWSDLFEPVPGWVAEKTTIETNHGHCKDSYRVIECPEYAPDSALSRIHAAVAAKNNIQKEIEK